MTETVTIPMTRDEFTCELKKQARHYYDTHPFHEDMNAGKLSKRQIQLWVANRFYYQKNLPLKDAAILSNCPDASVRQLWLQRIPGNDAEGTGQAGIESWLRLAKAVGLTCEEVLDERHLLAGVRFAVDAYVHFAHSRPWTEAIAASLSELFASNLMQRRIKAFEHDYPWMNTAGLTYLKQRLSQGPRLANEALEIVAQYCQTREQQERALAALAFKCDILWSMTDTIHHAAREQEGPMKASPVPSIVVTTQHNDNERTGTNLQEKQLNVNNVHVNTFGLLFKRKVDGQIYAQPLYVSGMNIPGKGLHNVVYVATMHNSVYAFDADDPQAATPLWQQSLEPSVPLPDINIGPRTTGANGKPVSTYHDISTEIGILSTPVISLENNALYVVTFTKTMKDANPVYSYHLHALDLWSGAEKGNGPVLIEASIPGTGVGSQNGMISFVANLQNQRPGLLLNNNVIYFAFAAFGDQGPYHGWILAYDAQTLQPLHTPFNITPDGEQGGIWQAGQGLAADSDHNVYCFIGKGSFDGNTRTPPTALGDCIIKLHPDLTLADWFSPANNQVLNEKDYDLGSSGPLLLPGTTLLVGGGKEGKLYVLDRNKLGNVGKSLQDFYVTPPDDPNDPFPSDPTKTHHIHGGPVYWNGPDGAWIYVWPENDFLKAFKLVNGTFQTTPISQSNTTDPTGKPGGSPGMPGGMLSISADGTTAGSGIVWASHPLSENANQKVVEGILRAYNASDLTKELWNSKQQPERDDVGLFAKFCPPTIANGKVYLATFGAEETCGLSHYLAVYGLLQSVSPGSTANA